MLSENDRGITINAYVAELNYDELIFEPFLLPIITGRLTMSIQVVDLKNIKIIKFYSQLVFRECGLQPRIQEILLEK